MTIDELYQFVTTNGIVIPQTSEVKKLISEEMNSAFNGLDLTDETPAGRIVEILTILFKAAIGINAQNANQMNLDCATGIFLDSLASNFLTERLQATRTRVEVTLTGDAGTVIPAGALAEATNGTEYSLENEVTIEENGSATGYMLCNEYGAITCPKNSITKIRSSIDGWVSISNQSEGVVGRDIESDSDLRIRIKKGRSFGRSFTESCVARLLEIDGVTSANVLENGDSSTKVIDGVTMSGHSIFACVDGMSDSNMLDVAKAIYNTKTAGCGFSTPSDVGTKHTISVQDKYTGVSYNMIAFDALYKQFKVVMTINDMSSADDVKSAIKTYVGSLNIGDDVYPSNIIIAINNAVPNIVVGSMSLYDGTTAVQYVSINGATKASINDSNITISKAQ